MASSKGFFAGVRNVASKAKNYVFDAFSPAEDEDLLADDEVYESDVEMSGQPAVSMSKEPEPAETGDDTGKAEAEPENGYSFGRGFLYAHQNDYTGRRSYEDNKRVAFSFDRNSSFGADRPAPSRTPAPSSSVAFGGNSGRTVSVPAAATSTIAASAGSSNVSDRQENTEFGFSFSGAKEPATFGSAPITRFEASRDVNVAETVKTSDDTGAVRAKAVVGFNTATNSGSQPSVGFNAQRNTKFGGVTMENLTVQVLKPTEISEATSAGTLLKKGVVVICNLSDIPDKNTRIRFSDFLCGCCKGCDADFSEIISVESPNAVLIAVPSSVSLKNPVPAARTEEKPQSTPIEIPGPDMSDIFSYTPSETPKSRSFYDIDL